MKQNSFFQDEQGNFSSLRLMFVIGMLAGLFIPTIFVISQNWTAGEFIAVFTSVSGTYTALKLGQKPMERKKNEK